jgi:hypothetical protein
MPFSIEFQHKCHTEESISNFNLKTNDREIKSKLEWYQVDGSPNQSN